MASDLLGDVQGLSVLHLVRLEGDSVTLPEVADLDYVIWLSFLIWSNYLNDLVLGSQQPTASSLGLRSQEGLDVVRRIVDNRQVLVSHRLIEHEDLVEDVVSLPVLCFAGVDEIFVIFWIGTLVLVSQQFSEEIRSSRCNTCLNQTFVLVTFDKWRNTKIQNEDVNELFHVDLEDTIGVLRGVVVHVGDVDGPIGEVDEALLLLGEFI